MSNTYAHETQLKATFDCRESEYGVCLQKPTHSFSDSISSRSLLCHTAFSNIWVLFKPFCSSWLLYCTESQDGWCVCLVKYIYVSIPHLSTFFSSFTVLLPLSSITDIVLSNTRSPLSLLLKVSFYLYSASFAPLSSSTDFYPFLIYLLKL